MRDRTSEAWDYLAQRDYLRATPAKRRRRRVRARIAWGLAWTLCAYLALGVVDHATPTSGPAWGVALACALIMGATWVGTR